MQHSPSQVENYTGIETLMSFLANLTRLVLETRINLTADFLDFIIV